MGADRRRRLPRPGPGPGRLRRSGAGHRRRARLPRRPAHRRDDPARLARLAAAAGGLRPGVTLGPCGGLSRLPHEVALRSADQLAAAGVTVVCLPQGSCGTLERPSPAAPSGWRPSGCCAPPGSRSRPAAGRCATPPTRWAAGDPLEAAYPAGLARRGPPRGAYARSAHAPEPPWGCPRSASRRASPPSCSRCAGTARRRALPGLQPHRGAPGPGGGPYQRGARVLRLRRPRAELGLPRQSQG